MMRREGDVCTRGGGAEKCMQDTGWNVAKEELAWGLYLDIGDNIRMCVGNMG